MGHSPIGIAPDLRAGAFEVGAWIVRVLKLIENSAFATALHLPRQINSHFHAACRRREDNFSTKGPHRGTALKAHIVGHNQRHPITHHRRRHSEGDTRIAAGRLNQAITRTDFPASLGLLDHTQCRPILHGTCRVVAFQFSQDDVAGVAR